MALIKCSNCGKEISSNAKACIHCGKELVEHYTSSVNGTEKNINFFLKLSKIFKYGTYIFAGLVLLIGLMSTGGTGEAEIFVICLIFSIILVIIAILSTPFLEWKAYMLKNIYELNQRESR